MHTSIHTSLKLCITYSTHKTAIFLFHTSTSGIHYSCTGSTHATKHHTSTSHLCSPQSTQCTHYYVVLEVRIQILTFHHAPSLHQLGCFSLFISIPFVCDSLQVPELSSSFCQFSFLCSFFHFFFNFLSCLFFLSL